MQDRVGDGVLGVGWWVPVLESSVVQIDENTIRLSTLGGESIFLSLVEPGVYESRGWRVDLTEGNVVKAVGPGGWTYAYRDGLIRKAVPPKGESIEWSYDLKGRGPEKISRGGIDLVIVRFGEEGKAKVIEVSGGPRFDFTFGDYPILSESGAIVDLRPAMSGFVQGVENAGASGLFQNNVTLETDSESSTVYVMHCDTPIIGKDRISWSVDGRLLSDLNGNYKFTKVTPGRGYIIKKECVGGVAESYEWDPGKFLQTYINGHQKVVTSFVGVEGASFLKKQKIEDYSADRLVNVKRNLFSESGGLLRTTEENVLTGKVRVSEFDEEGELKTIEEDGKVVSRNLGAGSNEVISIIEDGVTTSLKFENGKIVGLSKEK